MKRFPVVGLVLAALLAVANVPNNAADPSGVTAHEWGTFTSIAGADGYPVEWHPLGRATDLPTFVHRYRFDYKALVPGTVRMETPVLYFYGSRGATLRVSVGFRDGLITEWYPQAAVTPVKPSPREVSQFAFTSTATWKDVTLTPMVNESFPREWKDSHYYAARATDAVPITSGAESEKFLFYRGVGRFTLPLAATVAADGRVAVKPVGNEGPVGTTMLFENRGGRVGLTLQDPARRDEPLAMPALGDNLPQTLAAIENILIAEGLYAKEARAMIETWRDSWFEEGARLFYIVPQRTIDRVLPLTIEPRPDRTTRVFVGRMEIFTERTIDDVKRALAAGDVGALRKYGRFLDSIVNRIFAAGVPVQDQKRIMQLVARTYN